MNAVTLNQLSKIYEGGKKALDRVDISLERGEVFGFLGPNGAGKTTAVKLLNGMLTPTEGNCKVLGIDPSADPEKAHALCGVVTEHAQMYDAMTGLDNLIFYGSVFGLSGEESKRRGRALLEQLELSEAGDRKLASYSTGMRQRLSLARALIHEPQILFLDEPTSGLDPESAQKVHALIRNLAQEKGITVFLCTHQLRYAQEICTRYGLIDEGKLLIEGTLEELRKEVCSGITVTIEAGNLPDGVIPCQPRKCSDRGTVQGECGAFSEGTAAGQFHSYEVSVKDRKEIPQIIRRIVEAGGEIYHVSSSQPSLEDIYFHVQRERKESAR